MNPKGSERSRYTAVITEYLTGPEREIMLRWANWMFPNHCQLSPGQLIVHAFDIYGRRAKTLAREWCETHPDQPGWERTGTRPDGGQAR